jgi:hypothetical protein
MSHRDHNALQLPCGYLNCACFFKTQVGWTKHWNSAHRTFTVLHATSVEDKFEDLLDNIFTAGHDDFSPGDLSQPFGEPDNSNTIDTEFWGLADRLYCNFHSQLNSTFS